MNILKLQNGNDYIELRVTRYEFEKCLDSIEWLMIYGKVMVGGRKIEGEDPTIETEDFAFLKKWAQKIIKDKQNSLWETTEPNLYFKYNRDSNILEVYFCPERELRLAGKKVRGLLFQKECTHSDLESIIRWCDVVMEVFPQREPKEK